MLPKAVPPKFEYMTAGKKTYKTERPSVFATSFSCGAPFPGLQALCGGKLGFATAGAKQKQWVKLILCGGPSSLTLSLNLPEQS